MSSHAPGAPRRAGRGGRRGGAEGGRRGWTCPPPPAARRHPGRRRHPPPGQLHTLWRGEKRPLPPWRGSAGAVRRRGWGWVAQRSTESFSVLTRWLGASRAPLTPTGHWHGALPPSGGEGKNISAVRAPCCICNCPAATALPARRPPMPPSCAGSAAGRAMAGAGGGSEGGPARPPTRGRQPGAAAGQARSFRARIPCAAAAGIRRARGGDRRGHPSRAR